MLQPLLDGRCDIWIVLSDEGVDISVDAQDVYVKACDALSQVSMKVVDQIAEKGKELTFSCFIEWSP